MTTLSNEVLQKAENDLQGNTIPEWLEKFLGKTFFNRCPTQDTYKNELNKYCITCDASICKFCIQFDNHKEHKLLTVYRHVYQNAVPLSEMGEHLNCDTIQAYKCNKKVVVSLTPLPHNGSGLLLQANEACTTCKRKLSNPEHFRFCSITCKFEADRIRRIVSKVHGAGCSSQTKDNEKLKQLELEQVDPRNKRKRNRKGVPHRAPLF